MLSIPTGLHGSWFYLDPVLPDTYCYYCYAYYYFIAINIANTITAFIIIILWNYSFNWSKLSLQRNPNILDDLNVTKM